VPRGPIRRKGKNFEISLGTAEREALKGFSQQLREALMSEDPRSSPDLARLYRPASDDPLLNLEFERMADEDLLAQRLAALEIMSETAQAKILTKEQLTAWIGAINNTRLVLGTRLDVTQETTEEDFTDDPDREATYAIYQFLTWLLGSFVDALDPELE
jgi:Mg2+/Co2+ transporter CorC